MSLFQRETQETYTAVLNSSLNEELRTEENVASKSFLLSRELNYRSIIGNRNMIVLLYSLCVRKPVILRVSFSSFLKRVMLPQALKKMGNAIPYANKKWVACSDNKTVLMKKRSERRKHCALSMQCRRGPSSISVPNLKRIAQFVQLVIKGGPEIRKLCHVTPATPTYGSFYGHYARRLRPLCLYRI